MAKDRSFNFWLIIGNIYASTYFHHVIFSKEPKTLTLMLAHRARTRLQSIAPQYISQN